MSGVLEMYAINCFIYVGLINSFYSDSVKRFALLATSGPVDNTALCPTYRGIRR